MGIMASDFLTTNSKMTHLEHFLERRGISEDVINYIISENIDAETIIKMDEKELAEIFTKYGDRIAIIDFCKRQTAAPSKKKQGLLTKLRKKLKKRDKCSVDDDDSTTDDELPRPRKIMRKVELGWLHYDDRREKYVQVRTKFGGGTRTVTVPKETTKQFLISKCIELFFPNGKSTKGKIENMKYDIMDFKETILDDNISIEEIYKHTGLCILKFYLATTNRKYPVSETVVSGAYRQLEQSHSDNTQGLVAQTSNSDDCTQGLVPLVLTSNSNEFNAQGLVPLVQTLNSEEYNTQEHIQTVTVSTVNTNDIYFVQEQVADENVLNIKVHRGQVLTELINVFMNTNLDFTPVSVQMILPDGKSENALDTGGVFRDCLTEFWNSFYDQCTVGTNMKVPYVRHDFNADKWKAVAKIIHKGWIREKYFPVKLLSPFMECCILGSNFSDLSASFMNYVNDNDAEILKKALENFESVDQDDILDTFSNLEAKWNPTKDNIKQMIEDIAHRDVIQKPQFVIDCWKDILLGVMDATDLRQIYKSAIPKSRNVIELLSFPSDLNEDMIKTINFLKKYIREASQNFLASFLRYCTGADIITGNKIMITFIKMDGFQRCPIARTCGCILKLPYSYDNYPEFRYELNSLLSSNIWIMDII